MKGVVELPTSWTMMVYGSVMDVVMTMTSVMAMTSAKKKGENKENEVLLILQLAGYRVAQPGRQINYVPDGNGSRMPVVSSRDFFGAFDLLAVSGFRPTLFVQVCSKHAGDIAERKKKIEGIPLPRTDVAMLFAWHGGGKRVDLRFKNERRYKPYQYYNVYVYHYTGTERDGGWEWEEPIKVFKKVQIHRRCWVCNQTLRHNGICDIHRWADNGAVDL